MKKYNDWCVGTPSTKKICRTCKFALHGFHGKFLYGDFLDIIQRWCQLHDVVKYQYETCKDYAWVYSS